MGDESAERERPIRCRVTACRPRSAGGYRGKTVEAQEAGRETANCRGVEGLAPAGRAADRDQSEGKDEAGPGVDGSGGAGDDRRAPVGSGGPGGREWKSHEQRARWRVSAAGGAVDRARPLVQRLVVRGPA